MQQINRLPVIGSPSKRLAILQKTDSHETSRDEIAGIASEALSQEAELWKD